MQVCLSWYVHCMVYNNKKCCNPQSWSKSLNWGIFLKCILALCTVTAGICTCALRISQCPIDCIESSMQYFATKVVRDNKIACTFNIVWITFFATLSFLLTSSTQPFNHVVVSTRVPPESPTWSPECHLRGEEVEGRGLRVGLVKAPWMASIKRTITLVTQLWAQGD